MTNPADRARVAEGDRETVRELVRAMPLLGDDERERRIAALVDAALRKALQAVYAQQLRCPKNGTDRAAPIQGGTSDRRPDQRAPTPAAERDAVTNREKAEHLVTFWMLRPGRGHLTATPPTDHSALVLLMDQALSQSESDALERLLKTVNAFELRCRSGSSGQTWLVRVRKAIADEIRALKPTKGTDV